MPRCGLPYNSYTDKCVVDIPLFQSGAQPVGRLAALARTPAVQQTPGCRSEDTLADAKFRNGLPDQSLYGSYQGVRVALQVCVCPPLLLMNTPWAFLIS